ncbi:MAG: DUF4837 family protein [Gemmatimonadetes bacterium]|nr:DUF4837 family protein [Gemmatimonadota bacterium]
MRSLPKTILAGLAGVALLPVAACDRIPVAIGDVNSIIVTADPELWSQAEASLLPALERTVFTVRDEKTFKVTYQTPWEEVWFDLRLFKQQLLIGTESDPWMTDGLARVDEPVTPPQVLQARDVWVRDQLVTMVVLEEEGVSVEAVSEFTSTLAELFDRQYRDWVVARMFITGIDTAQARALEEGFGFSLLVPEVYDYEVRDSVHIFRNDNPDPSELIRQFSITWKSPLPLEPPGESLLEWRARIVEDYYAFPQVVNLENVFEGTETVDGKPAYTIQAVWENPPGEYPAAGPLIVKAIDCPDQDRRYFLDAWLYAPSREKYEYMLQLEEILTSFRCSGSR